MMSRLASVLFLACVACGGSTGSGGPIDGGLDGSGGSGFGGSGFGGSGFGGSGFGGSGTGGSGGTGGEVEAGCPPLSPGAQLGTYRLALSTVLGPTKPILYRAEVGDGPVLVLVAEPLNASDRTTVVGPPITLTSAPAGLGALHFGPVTTAVPGLANPLTGSDIEATVELTGSICGVSAFYCGDMSGNVTKPIALDLTGSTFTLETVASPDIHVNCAMSVADPLP